MSMTPGQSRDPGREIVTGADEAARLLSLEEQTPGLDREQEEATLRDAKAFYGDGGAQASADDNNDALMSEQDIQESGQ